ncbi:hypothetical protein MKEN_00957200 [Mycena kentingensis (nom. inval.)]|nr:hypothetical protein MKEN_00957200 [Mycena kentingensis (nom. inval.)]
MTVSDAPAGQAEDETYFFDDGDCIFLADNTIFRLHRAFLSRDPSSVFRNMFRDATGDTSEPIPLSDTAEDIRALCWLLYLPPGELYALAKTPGTVDVRKLLRILDMTHKYMMLQLETLASTMLDAIPAALPNYLATCTEEELEWAFELGIRHASAAAAPDSKQQLGRLLDLVETKWLTHIDASKPKFTYRRALDAGERHGRRKFQGRVYLRMHLIVSWTKGLVTSPSQDLQTHFGLTDIQFQRLLRGSLLLANIMPPRGLGAHLPMHTNCSYHAYCTDSWASINWKAEMARQPLVCLQNAKSKSNCAKQYLRNVPTDADLIADYFLGPVVSALADA